MGVTSSRETSAIAGVSLLVPPVAPGRLDALRREDLALLEGHDGDLVLVHDREHSASRMLRADLEVWSRPARRRVIAAMPSVTSYRSWK
jgi:hypothetical protein